MNKAFTLIELLISLAIIAIILVFSFYQYSQLKISQAESLMVQLQQLVIYAQLQSIKENTPITVCPIDVHGKCIDNWTQPVIVFTDPEKIHLIKRRSTILKKWEQQIHLSGQLKFSAFSSSRYITLVPLGLAGQQNGTFIYCDNSTVTPLHYGLSISKTGRTRLLWQDDNYFEEANRC